jgi:hypothetical protein
MDEFCFPCTSCIMAESTRSQLSGYPVRKIYTKERLSCALLLPGGGAAGCHSPRRDEPFRASSHIERIAWGPGSLWAPDKPWARSPWPSVGLQI